MKKLLIVDDELLIRDLLYDFFASHDYHIAMAETGHKALEILDREQIDCVLTDLKMPDMDGFELIERINSENTDVPVIIMTGFPSLESAIEALRKRVFDYVVKPFNVNKLLSTVENAITEAHGSK